MKRGLETFSVITLGEQPECESCYAKFCHSTIVRIKMQMRKAEADRTVKVISSLRNPILRKALPSFIRLLKVTS